MICPGTSSARRPSAAVSRARLTPDRSSSPSSERSAPLGSGATAATTNACAAARPRGDASRTAGAPRRGCAARPCCSSAIHQASRGASVSEGNGSTATVGAPRTDVGDRLGGAAMHAQRSQRTELLARGLDERRTPDRGRTRRSRTGPAWPWCRPAAPARSAPPSAVAARPHGAPAAAA